MAHVSVFSTILSILDGGVAKDSEGNITNFENCMVVFVSDLGNKEIIGKLNRECPEIKWPITPMEVVSTSEEGTVGSSSKDEMEKQETVGPSPTDKMVRKPLPGNF